MAGRLHPPDLTLTRRTRRFAQLWRAIASTLLLAMACPADAARVDEGRALDAAIGWLASTPKPMGRAAGEIKRVRSVSDAAGEVLFHVVDLEPAGYAVIAGDDDLECVVAFSHDGTFIAQPGSPLYDLLRTDLEQRVRSVQAAAAAGRAVTPAASTIRGKWQRLLAHAGLGTAALDSAAGRDPARREAIDDVRVDPMVETRWSQSTVSVNGREIALYNYYTPPYGAGTRDNFVAGCVATGFAQILRFHQWPKTGVGTTSYPIAVGGQAQMRPLRGGDGRGAPYNWAEMIPVPGATVTLVQREAIGALMHDVGVAMGTRYSYYGSSARVTGDAVKNVFRYASAAYSSDGLSQAVLAARTNLDAGLPVGIEIWSLWDGHVPVCDGYGYNQGTLYHHLNMGWAGQDDAWYNLPTVDDTYYKFSFVAGCAYNISPDMVGEIVSGRITGPDGLGLAGVTVTLAGTSVRSTTTNARGIFAFKGVTSNSTWTVRPELSGYGFEPAQASLTTGLSRDYSAVGNRVADFTSRFERPAPAITAQPQSQATAVGGSITLSAAASNATTGRWLRNGEALATGAGSTVTLSNLQPEDTGLYTFVASDGTRTATSLAAIVGVTSAAKVTGAGRELTPANVRHPNGNTFDQVLLTGAAEAITADPDQVTRTSFIDESDDIVQVEYTGPGTLSLVLSGASGPAVPVNYHQNVTYMKGRAGIVITGATERSNVTVFSVGRATAVDQGLFKAGTTYQGMADLAFIAVASPTGRFGGIRAANTRFSSAAGLTGVYAPGVTFDGPIFVGNITATATAVPVVLVGSAADVLLTGGDLLQPNGAAVQIGGFPRLRSTKGTDSHGNELPAQRIRATVQRDGVDVTAAVVVGP